MTDQKNILFTGGSGLLGSEFRKLLPDAVYPLREEFDVSDPVQMEDYLKGRKVEIVFHAAAFTSPPKVDKEPEIAINANIIGTSNVVKICMKHLIRLIYVSTDYVFRGDKGNYAEGDAVYPVNKYAWSKLGGECAVRMYDNSVIIRTSFGPNQFPYEKAFVDQWTSRVTVSKAAKMMLKVIDSDYRGVVHLGGGRKTVYEYASELDRDKLIGRISTSDVSFRVPQDTSLDTTNYKSFFERKSDD